MPPTMREVERAETTIELLRQLLESMKRIEELMERLVPFLETKDR